jgi:transposase-like protein
MGARKTINMSKTDKTAERPKGTRLSAAQKQQIARLYDLPATVRQIAEELDLPVTVVRRTLQEMVPADGNRWLEV